MLLAGVAIGVVPVALLAFAFLALPMRAGTKLLILFAVANEARGLATVGAVVWPFLHH